MLMRTRGTKMNVEQYYSDSCIIVPHAFSFHNQSTVFFCAGHGQKLGMLLRMHTAAFDTDGGPRPPEIMSDHQNIQTQWSDGPPRFSALSKIVTWPKNRSNRRHSRPIIQEKRYRSRPFSRNKTSVNNHAGHELLRSRLTIRSRPFYGTKDVFIIMRDMNY